VMDSREQLRLEAGKWQRVASFFDRFGRDVMLAAPRPVRSIAGGALHGGTGGVPDGTIPAWLGRSAPAQEALLEFSRFGSYEGSDTARRIAYRRNDRQEIELWLWPGLDLAPGASPVRYPVLSNVREFELQYLDAGRAWTGTWPVSRGDPSLPLAVRVRILLESGEELVRVFALAS